MADVVRVLGLDDDNHAPVFRMETGEIYNSPRELIEFLSHAHDVEYNVRMFSIVSEYSDTLEKHDPDDINFWFDYLAGFSYYEEADFGLLFDLFWDSANKGWW